MNYIFDLDGTLVDSLPWGVKIINKYIKKYPRIFADHQKLTAEQIQSRGTKQMLHEFNVSGWKLYFLVFIARREINNYKDKIKIFPGMNKQLEKLSKNNNLFVVTSNSKNHAQYILNKNGIAKYFEDINSSIFYFGKNRKLLSLMKKHNLDPKQTIYIGDETRDIEAAKNAGIKAVAVTWGYENKNVLSKSKPDHTISSPKQLKLTFSSTA